MKKIKLITPLIGLLMLTTACARDVDHFYTETIVEEVEQVDITPINNQLEELEARVDALEAANEAEIKIVRFIDPCGDSANHFDEFLIETTDGFVAWYDDIGLTVLVDGRYQTTDWQKCQFEISGTTYTELD